MSVEQEFWKHLGEDQTKADSRIGGRILQESIACNLGPVLDLSTGGARIKVSGNPHGRIDITLRDASSELILSCDVVWTRRRGFFKREIGVCFVDLTKEQAKQLTRMTMQNRVGRIFHGRGAA